MMNETDARTWLIKASLGITTADILFFLLAPLIGYPLEWPEAFRLMEIVFPVFLGYLGSATYFVFGETKGTRSVAKVARKQLGVMVRGPIIAWIVIDVAAIAAFGLSNRHSSRTTPMSLELFARILTGTLALLAVTTNIAVSYLFGRRQTDASDRGRVVTPRV